MPTCCRHIDLTPYTTVNSKLKTRITFSFIHLFGAALTARLEHQSGCAIPVALALPMDDLGLPVRPCLCLSFKMLFVFDNFVCVLLFFVFMFLLMFERCVCFVFVRVFVLGMCQWVCIHSCIHL